MKHFLRFLLLTVLTFSAEAGTTYRFNRWTTNDDSAFTLTIAELNALHGITVVPSTRTLTINGTTFDLSANRTWTIPLGDVLWGTNVDGTITNNSNLGISIGAAQKLYFGDASSGYLSFNSGSGAVVSSGPLTTPGLLSAASANVSGLTASRAVLTDGSKNLSSAAASGAVSIDADGSATTFPQVNALAPGNVVTQGYSFALTGSNATTVKVTSTTATPLTLQTAASAATNALEIQDSTGAIKANIYKDGSQTNVARIKAANLHITGTSSLGNNLDVAGTITATSGGNDFVCNGNARWRSLGDGTVIFVNNAGTSVATAQVGVSNVTKTANYTVVPLDVGKWLNNNLALTAVTNTLPTAASGMQFGGINYTNLGFWFNAVGSDMLYYGGWSGITIGTSDTNATIHMISRAANNWTIDSLTGTWYGLTNNANVGMAGSIPTPTTITFPATTSNWTNTFRVPIQLYIDNTAVTGTTIKKNGTQIFGGLSADVTLTLLAGEYFSETYSVGTPTGTWSPMQ